MQNIEQNLLLVDAVLFVVMLCYFVRIKSLATKLRAIEKAEQR